jgi:hypothetical protein
MVPCLLSLLFFETRLGKGYLAFEGTMREPASRPDVMAKYLEVI